MENNIKYLILVFITLILGIAFITIYADLNLSRTTLQSYTNTVNIAPLRTANGGLNYTLAESNKLYSTAILSNPAGGNWRQDYSQCAITTVNYYNQSGALMSSANDYTWVEDGNGAAGWLRLKNVANLNGSSSNLTTINYNSCPSGYVTGFGNSIMNIGVGLFVIMVLAAAAAYLINIFRDTKD
jgi:ABC-type glycerol-3-phosphate transport system permease component